MRRCFFLLLAVTVLALWSGASTGLSQDQPPDPNPKAEPMRAKARPSMPGRFGGDHGLGAAQPAKDQLPNHAKQPLPSQVDQNIAASDGNSGANYNEKLRPSLPGQPPAVIHSGTWPKVNTRHQGPNPAAIGGSMHQTAGQTGALNGTGMSQKH